MPCLVPILIVVLESSIEDFYSQLFGLLSYSLQLEAHIYICLSVLTWTEKSVNIQYREYIGKRQIVYVLQHSIYVQCVWECIACKLFHILFKGN